MLSFDPDLPLTLQKEVNIRSRYYLLDFYSTNSQNKQHRKKKGNGMAGKARRTTHRSSAGKKLYAVRDAKGRFKDIQTYERAHRADLARKSKAEKKKR